MVMRVLRVLSNGDTIPTVNRMRVEIKWRRASWQLYLRCPALFSTLTPCRAGQLKLDNHLSSLPRTRLTQSCRRNPAAAVSTCLKIVLIYLKIVLIYLIVVSIYLKVVSTCLIIVSTCLKIVLTCHNIPTYYIHRTEVTGNGVVRIGAHLDWKTL